MHSNNNNNCTLYLNSKREDCKCISGIKSPQYPLKSFSEREILKITGVFRTYRKDRKKKNKMIFPQMCIVSPMFVGSLRNKKDKDKEKDIKQSKTTNKNKMKVIYG